MLIKRMMQAVEFMGIDVLGRIIVGDMNCVGLKRQGLL
jgi:DNA repair protein RadC